MSFRGVFFSGYCGNPSDNRNYLREYKRNIEKQMNKLMNVKFIYSDYKELDYPENAFIYCDPPYRNAKKYHSGFNHDDFWEWCEMMSEKHTLFVSEIQAPDNFECVFEKEIQNSISDKYKKRRIERLFTLKK